ncbi:hypothetical protein GYMLUDRAFT_63656 [Collybiopsis luxurians FD-317 M1]|uniref:Uncharacterized protein n=1 Tax=Collybiopsis luxurians FD-317 M1 TaxID=944289 RepID=A0A0D0ASX4_9AGAR|nr:hypothetical protein GYMLUDRAFT_63656 [Collybiopsis luxurians FD-317 M1]
MPEIKEEVTSSPVGELGVHAIIPVDQEHTPAIAPQHEVCPAFAGEHMDYSGDQTHEQEHTAYYTGNFLYAGSNGEEGSMEFIMQTASAHHSLPANQNIESLNRDGIQNLRNLPPIVPNRNISPFIN